MEALQQAGKTASRPPRIERRGRSDQVGRARAEALRNLERALFEPSAPVEADRRSDLAEPPTVVPPTKHGHVKRLFDLISAVGVLVVLAPLMLVISLLVKLDSPGPVLFKQRRLGKGMQGFPMLKFRTMAVDAPTTLHEEYIAKLATANPTAGGDRLKKLVDDPRVTRLGAVLRRLSLDELPQLFNVLTGQMSLVGPRPALDYEVEHYRVDHFARFEVRPGMTGLWQVSGRNEVGFMEMLELDAEYAREASALTDLRILARTPRAAIGRTA